MPKLKQKRRSLIKIERNIPVTDDNRTDIVKSLQKKLLTLNFEHINPQNIEDDLFIYKSKKYLKKGSLILIFFDAAKICTVVKEEIPVDQIIFKAENTYCRGEIPTIIKNVKLLQKVING